MAKGMYAAALAAVLLVTTTPLEAAERVWFVPWKVLDPGTAPDAALFVLYWIPESPEDLRRSELVTSRALAIYSARCVAMHVVRIDDIERLERLGAAELPVALIADGNGEIARLNGAFRSNDVIAMVREEFAQREIKAEKALQSAQQCLREGDRQCAAAQYETVARQHCSFPRKAKAAQKALRRLE